MTGKQLIRIGKKIGAEGKIPDHQRAYLSINGMIICQPDYRDCTKDVIATCVNSIRYGLQRQHTLEDTIALTKCLLKCEKEIEKWNKT